MRELKFRAWDVSDKDKGPYMLGPYDLTDTIFSHSEVRKMKLMQYVGLKDKNGKEIYEGDIFRIEESGQNGEPDEIFYVVITWIKEWCMFGSLIAKSEYQDYIDNGVKALDEPLFWTYTLEDTDSIKHFLCGNIYETPNLLK